MARYLWTDLKTEDLKLKTQTERVLAAEVEKLLGVLDRIEDARRDAEQRCYNLRQASEERERQYEGINKFVGETADHNVSLHKQLDRLDKELKKAQSVNEHLSNALMSSLGYEVLYQYEEETKV